MVAPTLQLCPVALIQIRRRASWQFSQLQCILTTFPHSGRKFNRQSAAPWTPHTSLRQFRDRPQSVKLPDGERSAHLWRSRRDAPSCLTPFIVIQYVIPLYKWQAQLRAVLLEYFIVTLFIVTEYLNSWPFNRYFVQLQEIKISLYTSFVIYEQIFMIF